MMKSTIIILFIIFISSCSQVLSMIDRVLRYETYFDLQLLPIKNMSSQKADQEGKKIYHLLQNQITKTINQNRKYRRRIRNIHYKPIDISSEEKKSDLQQLFIYSGTELPNISQQNLGGTLTFYGLSSIMQSVHLMGLLSVMVSWLEELSDPPDYLITGEYAHIIRGPEEFVELLLLAYEKETDEVVSSDVINLTSEFDNTEGVIKNLLESIRIHRRPLTSIDIYQPE